MPPAKFLPLTTYREYPPDEMDIRAAACREDMQRRRTVRSFARRSVRRSLIEDCLMAAGSAPSGANMQPWHFVVVSDPEIKRQIRAGAEQEEREFYRRRASPEWLGARGPPGAEENKPVPGDAPDF